MAGQVAYTHNMIRLLHTAFLNSIDGGIDISTTAVEVGGMDVDDQRFARYMLGEHACGVSQPVMGVDDVEIKTIGEYRRHRLVVTDFLDKVVGIAPGESHTAEVVGTDTAEVVMYAITEMEILLGRHSAFHTLTHIVVTILLPHNGYAVCADNAQERLVFVAPWFGNNESDVHIGLLCHTACQSVTGGT